MTTRTDAIDSAEQCFDSGDFRRTLARIAEAIHASIEEKVFFRRQVPV